MLRHVARKGETAMSTQHMPVGALAPDERRSYRVGGMSAVAIGMLYLVIIALYAVAGPPPIGGEAWLTYLADKTSIWWAIIGLSVLTNFLFVPVALALYFALRRVSRSAMLVAVAFVGLFVVLELAVNWVSYAALVILSNDYASATTDVQRATYVTAAALPSAVIASPLALVYAVGTLSFGLLVVGLVMLKGVFSRVTAYLAIITGLLGLLAVAGVRVAVILNAVGATLWLFWVGSRLYRLEP
jgi:hypothetical protein